MTNHDAHALTPEQKEFDAFLDKLVRAGTQMPWPHPEDQELQSFAVDLHGAEMRRNQTDLGTDPVLKMILAAQQQANEQTLREVGPNDASEQAIPWSRAVKHVNPLINWAAIVALLLGSVLLSARLLTQTSRNSGLPGGTPEVIDQAVSPEWTIRPSTDLSAAPLGISIAPDGTIWVPTLNQGKIEIYSPDGDLVESWGEPGSGPGQFSFGNGKADYPLKGVDIAWDSQGNIYVTDRWNHRVQKFDASRTYLLTFEEVNFVAGSSYAPYGIAVGRDDTIYINDDISQTVYMFDTNGMALGRFAGTGTTLGIGPLPGIPAIALDGNVLIPACRENTVSKYAPDGTVVSEIGTSGSGPGEFNCPRAVAVSSDGMIFVADEGNARVQVFNAQGEFMAEWSTLSDGSSMDPIALEAADGYLYVLDHSLGRIIKIAISENLKST